MPSVVRIAISEAMSSSAHDHPLDPGAGAEIGGQAGERPGAAGKGEQHRAPACR